VVNYSWSCNENRSFVKKKSKFLFKTIATINIFIGNTIGSYPPKLQEVRMQSKPKATILVVDDEQIVFESVRRILEEEGYRVDGALRVEQAKQKLKTIRYDLAMTDIMMPEASGLEVIDIVARDHPDTGVVVFTGYPSVVSAVHSMKLGALDYVSKPFTPDELLRVVKKSLDKITALRREREIANQYAEAEKAVASSLDLKQILDAICTNLVKLFDVKGSGVLVYKKKDGVLDFAAFSGLSEAYVRKGSLESSKSIANVFQSGGPTLAKDADFDRVLQYPEEARREGIKEILSIPLALDSTIIGFLRVYYSEAKPFREDELNLLLKFAEKGARAMENAMAYQRLRDDLEEMKNSIPAIVSKEIGMM
jgi:ActR/RegA family two-component response regulator